MSFRISSYLVSTLSIFQLILILSLSELFLPHLSHLISSQLSSSPILWSCMVHSHLSFYHLLFSSLLILPSISLSFWVLSHLARNLVRFGTWCVSPLSSVRLGICECGNRARIRAKTIGLGLPERGGLGSIENELWSSSVVVRKQSDPTDQWTRLYHNV